MFDGLEYTRDALAKELYLIELHAKDGSAVDAACACIQEKHLLGVEGLALEGVTLAKNEAERKFYSNLAAQARELRKKILYEEWKNPHNPDVHNLKSCIEKVELKCCGGPTKDYSKCSCNPQAVCRASVH